MTDKKWTPGPWAVDRDNYDYPMFISGEGDDVIRGCGCCGSPNMTMTNANLIAAAPDLYDALEVAEESIVAFAEGVGVYGYSGASDVLVQVRAAMAKARGET